MSSLSPVDKAIIKEMFTGFSAGYVLNFSNNSFQSFVLRSVGIDVYGERYNGYSSKMKKLIHFLDVEEDSKVGKLLQDLLEYRNAMLKKSIEMEGGFIDKFADDSERISKVASAMINGSPLFTTDKERFQYDVALANEVLDHLLSECRKLCKNAAFDTTTLEDVMNDYIRDMIGHYYPEIADQTRQGLSEKKKRAGEVDILIKRDGKDIALIEGLRLKSVNSDEIGTHIKKAVDNYNALGTPAFLLVYYQGTNLTKFWERFCEFLKTYNMPDNVSIKRGLVAEAAPDAAIKVADMIVCKNQFDFPLHFIVADVAK